MYLEINALKPTQVPEMYLRCFDKALFLPVLHRCLSVLSTDFHVMFALTWNMNYVHNCADPVMQVLHITSVYVLDMQYPGPIMKYAV